MKRSWPPVIFNFVFWNLYSFLLYFELFLFSSFDHINRESTASSCKKGKDGCLAPRESAAVLWPPIGAEKRSSQVVDRKGSGIYRLLDHTIRWDYWLLEKDFNEHTVATCVNTPLFIGTPSTLLFFILLINTKATSGFKINMSDWYGIVRYHLQKNNGNDDEYRYPHLM